MIDDAPRIEPTSRAEWRAWLARNHGSSKGVWLLQWKRHTGHATVPYEDAVEEALCFGWIDGRLRRLDTDRSAQWFSPRRPKGTWARTNKERVARLEAAGLMTDAGRSAIAIARANGSWNSLDEVEALTMPPDLEAALASAGARAHFDSRSEGTRRMTLAYVTQVKRADLRAARIQKVVDVCIRQEPLSRIWQPRD